MRLFRPQVGLDGTRLLHRCSLCFIRTILLTVLRIDCSHGTFVQSSSSNRREWLGRV